MKGWLALAAVFIITATQAQAAAFHFSAEDTSAIPDVFGQAIPASEAIRQRDYTPVRMEGFIRKHLSKDLYLFQDDSGTAVLQIQTWDAEVGPSERVTVAGYVDSGAWYSMYAAVYVTVEHLKKECRCRIGELECCFTVLWDRRN